EPATAAGRVPPPRVTLGGRSRTRNNPMSESIKVRSIPQAHCKDCSLSTLCLPLSLNMTDMDALDEIVKRGRPLKKGEFLFRQGDSFTSVFAVRSGALKTFSISDTGEEQITGFHLPSELVGLSGMD